MLEELIRRRRDLAVPLQATSVLPGFQGEVTRGRHSPLPAQGAI